MKGFDGHISPRALTREKEHPYEAAKARRP